MNIVILQWGLVSFIIGLILSLPLAAVSYGDTPPWARIFTNPRKLKSAHLDFFMQALAAGFVYLLELAAKSEFPLYVVIPLIFGIICNPLILLIEATPLYRSGFMAIFYRFLKATSPLSLLFAWLTIAMYFLPLYLILFTSFLLVVGLFVVWSYRSNAVTKENSSNGISEGGTK